MRRIKHKNGYSYELTYWNGNDAYSLVARHYPKADGRQGYKVWVKSRDGLVIEVPDLGGKTPQIAFAEVKKYLQEKYPADPKALAMELDYKNSLRRSIYRDTKKKKPYVPSKTKS
jgi:hypothetical protein